VLGVAGGDGSQALVAAITARHGLPVVVVGALDAYGDGVDLRVDLGEVNGRPFVNNASMGLYAQVVPSAEYRDAKVATAASIQPDLLGPGASPQPLRFTTPEGDDVTGAQLLLVANNPYRLRSLRGAGTRERLDGGVLGVVAVSVAGPVDAEELVTLELAGHAERFTGWREWTTPRLVVRSELPVPVGMDGEALTLPAPLEFVSRLGALTVRVPRRVAQTPPSAGGADDRAIDPAPALARRHRPSGHPGRPIPTPRPASGAQPSRCRPPSGAGSRSDRARIPARPER